MTASKKVCHVIRFRILFLFPLSLSYNRDREREIPRKGSFSAKETGPEPPYCHTRVSGHQDPGANIITRCAGTKSHTYDESWHMIECHIFTIQ
jgi:hypothetical protein